MWFLLLAACGADLDHDGAAGGQDCDDADPHVYPGAADLAGDGLDADCDGEDPPLPYLGAWKLDTLTASYSGVEFLAPDAASGSLELSVEEAALRVVTDLDPSVIGAAITVDLRMRGALAPLPGPDTFALYAEGNNFDEQMHADWDCWLAPDGRLECLGELKALELSLLADVSYVRP